MSAAKSLRQSSSNEVTAFLRDAASSLTVRSQNRLIFTLDATASRQPTWDRACHLQAEMFSAAAGIGGLQIQLAWYRGLADFTATSWHTSSKALAAEMSRVLCAGGLTQIERVLRHALRERAGQAIRALVFIGDAMEEDPATLYGLAGQLGLFSVPVFIFHEGGDKQAGAVFSQIARLSAGAYCPFDSNSSSELRSLLGAVAVYAAGGKPALIEHNAKHKDAARALLRQLR